MSHHKNRTIRTLVLSAFFTAGLAAPAFAHRLSIFATADGAKISGYAYLSGGARATGVDVHVSGPSGEKLGTVKTDDQGEFAFKAEYRLDHVFKIETADGHAAVFTVKAAELPAALPPFPGSAQPDDNTSAGTETVGEVSDISTEETDVTAAAPAAEFVARLEQVNRQVIAMREQLDKLCEKRRIQDVVGGIGYLLGLAGIAFYFAGKRSRSRKAQREV